ncbi:MAG: segregation/condensation protein A [Planctomycetota bacterium]
MTAESQPTVARTADYRVRLDAFEGPLDLLLHLIRRSEVDLHDIPIAAITDQYLGHLEHVDRVDVELAGEFLVMAATLMEIKSRMLQPEERADESGEQDQKIDRDDPRAELVRQLLDYKRYRDAGDELDRRREQWERRHPVAPAIADKDAMAAIAERQDAVELEDLDVSDLVAAFERIYEAVNFERIGQHEVEIDDTPIELHAEDLIDRLKREPGERMPLQSVFAGRRPGEMLGLFLAMLEMLKQQRLGAEQPNIHGPIEVFLRPDAELTEDEVPEIED